MENVWWILLGIIIAPCLWFVLQWIVGAATPKVVSGKLLLKKELARRGADVSQFDDGLLTELTENAMEMARLFKNVRNEGVTEGFVKNIESIAAAVVSYINGDKPLFDSDPIYEALKRRGLIGG